MRIDPDTCRDPDLLAAEVRRLNAVIAAGEPTLTDAERGAIMSAVWDFEQAGCATEVEILLGLVERFGQTPVTKPLSKEIRTDVLSHPDGRIYVSGQTVVD